MYYVKSPKELGLRTDCQGIYVETTKHKIEAMVTTKLLEFGVGDTREDAAASTIASRMKNHETSKNLDWQHYLLDSIPKPGYRDYALHRVIAQTFAAQLEHPETGRKNEVFQVAVPDELIKEFTQTSDFENIRQWLSGKIRSCAATLNPKHAKVLVTLRDIQQRVINKITDALIRNGLSTNFICELAPRIGKTILFLTLANQLHNKYGHEAMFVMAYGVGLSVKTSYKDEINKYIDFSSMKFIDASEESAELSYSSAIANNLMPVVFVSLNADAEEKFDWIRNLTGTYISLLEETDFGTHTDEQIKKTEFILENKTVTRINASGTNIGRVAKAFGKNAIDEVISVPYAMVEQDSSIPNVVLRKFYNMLFNPKMNKLLEEFDDEVLPNINKILNKPLSQQKFIGALFQDLFGYQPIYRLNLSDCAGEDIRHAMLFVNIHKEAMEQLAKVIENACPNHKVLILNGDHTNNKEAEGLTKEELVRMQNKYYGERTNLLVITNMMGTRSYSIPEIQAVIFMQEGGDVYPYMQRYSRCLTPGFDKKFGHIFDFSFDQNKTRNTVMSIAVEALALVKETGVPYPDAVRQVLHSVNIKDMLSGSWVSADDIIKQFEDNNKLLEIANAHHKITIEDLTDEEIAIFGDIAKSNAKGKGEKTGIDNAIKTGKTFSTPSTGNRGKKTANPLKQVIEKAVRLINGSATTVLALGNYEGESFLECVELIAADLDLSEEFSELYGIGPESILRLADKLELPTLDMIIQMSKYNTTQKHIENSSLAILKDDPELWREIFMNRRLRRFVSSKKCNKILVVAGGHGSEIDMLVDMFGLEIVNKIVYNDKYSFFCNQIKRKYPSIAVCRGNFLKMEFDMKFDCVVGNPPYQSSGAEKGGARSLWRKFVTKSFDLVKDNGYVSLVCPGFPWNSSDIGPVLTDNTPIYLNNNVGKFFKGIGSSFKVWIVQRGNHPNNKFIVDGIERDRNFEENDPTMDSVKHSIFQKMRNRELFICKQDSGYNSTQLKNDPDDYFEKPTGESKYPIRHASNIKVCYVKKPTACHSLNKVMMTFSGYPQFEYYDETTPISSCYQMSGYITVENKKEGINLINVYNSKLYKFLSNGNGSGGMRSITSYSLPKLNLSRSWTDQEIYDHFGLTQEEIDYIEANVK
jgi:hypothetical protein